MARAICPGCRSSLDLDRYVEVGDFLNCARCGADLELTSLHPLVLAYADTGFEGANVTWTPRANAQWSKRDKGGRRKARAKFSDDFFELD